MIESCLGIFHSAACFTRCCPQASPRTATVKVTTKVCRPALHMKLVLGALVSACVVLKATLDPTHVLPGNCLSTRIKDFGSLLVLMCLRLVSGCTDRRHTHALMWCGVSLFFVFYSSTINPAGSSQFVLTIPSCLSIHESCLR